MRDWIILNKNIKSGWIKTAIKLLIAALLLYALYRLGSLDYKLVVQVLFRPEILIVSSALLFLGILLGGVRWWMLLKISGHHFKFIDILKLQLVGGFFSTYLPGAAGGDLVRGAYLFKAIPKNEGRTTALLSIAVDRVFALLGLIFVGAAASAYIFASHVGSTGLGPYTNAMLFIVICSPVGLFALALATIKLPRMPIFRLFPPRLQTYLTILADVAKSYLTKSPQLLACSVISIAASAIVAFGIVIISSVFTFAAPPIVTAIAGVFGNVFSAIPITPGGVGVGESAFLAVSRELTGLDAPFASIYLTFRLMMFVANLPGGVLILIDRTRGLWREVPFLRKRSN